MKNNLMILFTVIITIFILGVILLSVGYNSFNRKAIEKKGSIHKTFFIEEKVKSIDIESNALDFSIKNSDTATNITISIEDFVSENNIEYKIENDCLYIKAIKNEIYPKMQSVPNMSKLILIIPSNLEFKNFVFNSRASEVKGNYIKAENVKIATEASDFSFNNIISDNTIITSKMGNTEFKNIETKDLIIENDAGKIDINALTKENINIKNNVGQVIIKLNNINEYNYKIKNQVGNVAFGNESFSGINTKVERNIEKSKTITIDNNVGNTQVR